MTGIVGKIDNSIICWLKLHRTTLEDLTNHVQNDMSHSEITSDGINARLATLCKELKIFQFNIHGKLVWGTSGEQPTITNKVWEIVSQLVKNEYSLENIIYTITKQNPEFTPIQIFNAVGILEANEIIHVKHQIVILTDLEKSFIHKRNQN